ncbi:transglutaminase-like domain-containing protein [Psychroserpens sp.]|uniref:transglutaminase domain-containing protein n=1 Tax=Psychroserpens sp. TaxID=2020870 RepID=UPI00385BCC05
MKNAILFFLFISLASFGQQSDFKSIDFTRADNIALLNAEADLDNLPILAHQLTSKLSTDVEKFRAIYSWVCNNISGDPNQHNTVGSMRRKLKNDSIALLKWNKSFKKIAFKKLLKQKKTMCTGYAYLIKELCFLSNLECEIIDGYAISAESNTDKLDTPNHSWNAVKLNNKWYLSDATWSSGYMLGGILFVKEYNDGYFLADPILFAKSHYPLYKKWLLNQTLIENEFNAGPIVYGETFEHHIIPIGPEQLETTIEKNSEINFSFQTTKQISKSDIDLVKVSKHGQKKLKIYNIETNNGRIQFKHQFNRRGLHDVHLRVKNDIVATYTVKVERIK